MKASENDNYFMCKDTFLHLLYLALLEIRAASDIKTANYFADIFHNIPKHLSNDWDSGKAKETLEVIMKKAGKYGMENEIIDLIEHCKSHIKKS